MERLSENPHRALRHQQARAVRPVLGLQRRRHHRPESFGFVEVSAVFSAYKVTRPTNISEKSKKHFYLLVKVAESLQRNHTCKHHQKTPLATTR